jgi:hypothetical protein
MTRRKPTLRQQRRHARHLRRRAQTPGCADYDPATDGRNWTAIDLAAHLDRLMWYGSA